VNTTIDLLYTSTVPEIKSREMGWAAFLAGMIKQDTFVPAHA